MIDRVNGWLSRVSALPWGLVILYFLAVAAPGAALDIVLFAGGTKLPLTNDLDAKTRLLCLLPIAGSIMLFTAPLVGYYLKRGDREQGLLRFVAGVAPKFAPLLATVLLGLIFRKGIEKEYPQLLLACTAGAAFAAGWWVYQVPESIRTRLDGIRVPRAVPWVVLVLFFVGQSLFFSWLSVVHHRNMGTKIHDLGIYDNIFWHASHGDGLSSPYVKGGSHTAAHFDPILIVLSPIYLIYQRAETILVLQSIWLASGVFPLFLLARRYLKSNTLSLTFCLLWGLHPALQGANLYDFHSLTLSAPVALWLLLALVAESRIGVCFALPILLSIREDLSLVSCCIAVWVILTSEKKHWGLAIIATSLTYFVLVKLFAMPDASLLMKDTSKSYAYGYYFKDVIPNDGEGAGGILLTLITNPGFVLKHAFSETKFNYLAALLLPLACVPLLARRSIVLLAYGTMFLFLASKPAVPSLNFHYSVLFFPFAFFVTIEELSHLDTKPWIERIGLSAVGLRNALVCGMIVTSAVLAIKVGALSENDVFKPGNQRFERTTTQAHRERYQWLKDTIKTIPRKAVLATTDHIGPHVSNRPNVHYFPYGKNWEYLLLDRENMDAKQKADFEKIIQEKTFEKVTERGTISLWRLRNQVANN